MPTEQVHSFSSVKMTISYYHLTSLPFALLCDLLNNWLSIRELAKLDWSCCNRVKSQILRRILSSPQFVQRKTLCVSRVKEFAWFVSRSIGVYTIDIDAKLQVSQARFDYFELWGKDVREVHFRPGASGDLFIVLMHCRNLVSVSFLGPNTAQVFCDVLSNNRHLEEVRFVNVNIEPYLLRSTVLPRLHTLQLTSCGLGKDLSERLSLLSDCITRLRLSDLLFVDIVNILNVLRRFKELRTLDLSGTSITNEGVNAITLMCTRILNLQLTRCEESVAQILVELRTLDIRGCKLTDQSFLYLAKHRAAQLVTLYVDIEIPRMSTVVTLLQKCTRLHTLGLVLSDDCRLWVDETLHSAFQAVAHVQRLYLHGAGLIHDDILTLVGQYCHCLTHIELRPIEEYEDEFEDSDIKFEDYFTAKGLFALKVGCPRLRRLIVYKDCPLLENELAVRMWQDARRGLMIISEGSIDYDAMKSEM